MLFRLAGSYPSAVVEGWWRRERRARANREFAGWTEVFCRCDPVVAERRMRARAADARHPIHRDVINPSLLDSVGAWAAAAEPLHLGGPLIELDTTEPLDVAATIIAVRTAIRN